MSDRTSLAPEKPNFDLVKKEIGTSIEDENAKLVWTSVQKWLEDDGEKSVKEQVTAIADSLRTECLARLAEWEAKIPEET